MQSITRTVCVVVVGTLVVSGCSGLDRLHDQYVVNSAVVPNNQHPVTGAKSADPINLDCYVFPEHEAGSFLKAGECTGWKAPAAGEMTAYKFIISKINDTSSNGGRIFRNRLIDTIEERSNEICHIHKAHILSNAAAFNFLTGLTSTVLSGVSSVVGGEAAKTILSAASSSVGVLGAEIRSNFYQNILAPAVIRKINELRKRKLEKIVGRFVEPGNQYTIVRAIRDLNEYHRECSFFRGIVELAEGTREEPMSRKEIDAEILALRTDNSKLEPKFVGKDLNKEPVAREARRQWDANNIRLFELHILRQKTPLRTTTTKKDTNGNGSGGNADKKPGVKKEKLPDLEKKKSLKKKT